MDSSHKRSWHEIDFGAAFGTAPPLVDDPSTRIRIDETASAATRQKSCNACVRGKRRCDKRTPRCSRCAAKNLDCIYQKMPPSASGPGAGVGAPAEAVPASASASSTMSDVPDFESLGFDLDSMGTDTSPESLHADSYCPPMSAAHTATTTTTTAPGMDFNLADLMGPADHEDIWNLHPFADAGGASNKLDIPAVPAAPSLDLNTDGSFNSLIDEVISASSSSSSSSNVKQLVPLRDASVVTARLESKCAEFDPMQAHDPTTSLGYTVDWLTGVHSLFAKTRSLPFIHPRLWTANGQQLPKPVLTAFSASAAYVSRTPSSKGWTVRLLADAGREIHREGERASSPAEKLARVQGLIILDTMRIFDGDLGLRASTEREVPVLLEWLKDLVDLRDSMEGDGGMKIGRDKPPKSWEHWIFLESTRRTILASYALVCIFCFLKSDNSLDDIWTKHHRFTASRHLWNATSSVEFFRSWRDKPQFVIDDMSFREFWMYARPEDCDEFTELMLTSHMGVDVVKHFMSGETSISSTGVH